MCGVVIVSFTVEAEFCPVGDGELVVGVYCIVEAVQGVGPRGFEEGAVPDWVVDYGFAEHGIVGVVVDFD